MFLTEFILKEQELLIDSFSSVLILVSYISSEQSDSSFNLAKILIDSEVLRPSI